MSQYNYLEPVLQKINQKFISLSEEDETTNNEVLGMVVELFIDKMKNNDSLFRQLFQRVFYGGSYYEGLRVAEPNEFDLNLLLKLPETAEPNINSATNIPGYVVAHFSGNAIYNRQRISGLDNLITSNYLDTERTLQWMEKVITLALNDLPQQESWYTSANNTRILLNVRKHGPAFTLEVRGRYKFKDISFDIDLVPCFVFGQNQWPQNGFRANPVRSKPEFFIVPKPLKTNINNKNLYWRLAFQEQERSLMADKNSLKPTIKLLKQLRDRYGDQNCIASYFLKTVVLWQIEARHSSFWENSLSYIFITMLKEYYKFLSQGKIPNFWNRYLNLIENINSIEISNIARKIKSIIDEVESSRDPMIIAKILLTQKELREL